MPDLDLVTVEGSRRVFNLLHAGRPTLLNLGKSGGIEIAPWANRVKLIDPNYSGAWQLPALGVIYCSQRSHTRLRL
jgi:3-(3-hydroxy-phenyl)propionate hydroxylase